MTDEEIAKAAALLAKLEPGYLPQPLFDQIMRLSTAAIVEIVPLRRTQTGIEIFLLERPADDSAWPGQLHSPGTVIRPTDTSYDMAIDRVLTEELDNPKSKPVFVRTLLHRQNRGNESSLIYFIELSKQPKGGAFYDVEHIPQTIISTQMDFTPDAIAAFKKSL
jgi:hypothetical protein